MNLSLKYFQVLSANIRDIVNSQDRDVETDLLADKLKHYIQVMVQADKAGIEQIYDYFCEANDMDVFRKLLQFDKVTVVRTISLLLINVKNELWISYILSHPIMTQLISIEVEQQDQLAEYYISFLKSLSIRLSIDQVNLFFNKKFSNFPLIYQSLKFYNHSDNMVRTSVMNLTLGIMKSIESHYIVKNQRINKYFSSFPFTTYFIHFCCLLNDEWRKLDDMLGTQITKHKLKMQISDQNDSLYYLYDVYQYGSPQTVKNLKNCVISYNILPTLAYSFINKGISPKLSLYLLLLFLKIFKDPGMQELISIVLFGKNIQKNLLQKINRNIYIPLSYNNTYKNQYYWDKFKYEMAEHCQKWFQDVNNFQTDHEISKKNGQISQNSEQFMQQITKISNFVGFNLLNSDQEQKGGNQISKLCDYRNPNTQWQENPIRNQIISILQEKDEASLWIITNIIITIQKKDKISNDVLVFCGILMPRLDTINYLNEFNIKSILQIKQIMLTQLNQQSKYRISTIRNLIILLDELIFREFQKNELELILDIYDQSIKELRSTKHEDMINLIKLFEEEYKKWINHTLIHQISIPFSVFLSSIQSYPQIKEEQHLPINDKQKLKRKIIFFTMLKHFLDRYALTFKKLKLTKFQEQFNTRFNHTISKWKVQKSYDIQNRPMVECKIIEKQKKTLALIVEDDHNFVLIVPNSENTNQGLILVNTKYKYFDIEISKQESKNAIVRWSQDQKGQMLLNFSSDIQCLFLFEKIKQRRKNSYGQQNSFIQKFLMSCQNDIQLLRN